MNWSVIGLSFDIVGAVLLFIGTELLNYIIHQLIRTAAHSGSRSGPLGGGAIVQIIERTMEPKKKLANWFSKMGLALIILGFLFQLMGSLN